MKKLDIKSAWMLTGLIFLQNLGLFAAEVRQVQSKDQTKLEQIYNSMDTWKLNHPSFVLEVKTRQGSAILKQTMWQRPPKAGELDCITKNTCTEPFKQEWYIFITGEGDSVAYFPVSQRLVMVLSRLELQKYKQALEAANDGPANSVTLMKKYALNSTISKDSNGWTVNTELDVRKMQQEKVIPAEPIMYKMILQIHCTADGCITEIVARNNSYPAAVSLFEYKTFEPAEVNKSWPSVGKLSSKDVTPDMGLQDAVEELKGISEKNTEQFEGSKRKT